MNNLKDTDMLTVGAFKSLFEPAIAEIGHRFGEMDKKMMDGFTMLDKKIDLVDQYSQERDEDLKRVLTERIDSVEIKLTKRIDSVETNLSAKIDELAITKADREELLVVQKRVMKLEAKAA